MAKIRSRKPAGKCASPLLTPLLSHPPSACEENAYEALRQARIAENQARLAALGVQKQAGDLKAFFRATKTPQKSKDKVALQRTPVRRSQRLKELAPSAPSAEFRRSERFAKQNSQTPPPGKTDCSICHSSTGVFCRACLKIRYGEDIEEVRQNKDWVCPHCSELQGINPYWICNSSICLKKRNIPPTGIAIFTAREMGYKSVAHYLVDVLKKQGFSGN